MSRAKRFTRKADVQMAGAGLLLAVWKLVSTYREYQKDSQEEGQNATA